MGSLGRCLARSLLRGQPGPSRPPGPRCYGSAPPELQEKTLVLVKPDAVQRRLVGNVIQRFERRGFKLVAMKLLQVWEGYNVVRSTRAMVGDTDSATAAAGTIRGDFSMHVSRNVVHASDSVETAQREISFWFQQDELVAWDSGDQDYTYGP
ncbi:nucleoside diphosphate kinase, mitochondrial isoform X2 [Harpia harpyja]|uniref:nucleoside diphosphate kinase, mitochondrial isoform X2 n=1 Tax=Harpia harpyja TaxID=202280 RepID=UPI0022B09A91|nr:nucleoside diphosphate kinase, mitochondrial isoform X2 [Harpia harpyja]